MEHNEAAACSLFVGENPEGHNNSRGVHGGGEASLGLGIAWEGSLKPWRFRWWKQSVFAQFQVFSETGDKETGVRYVSVSAQILTQAIKPKGGFPSIPSSPLIPRGSGVLLEGELVDVSRHSILDAHGRKVRLCPGWPSQGLLPHLHDISSGWVKIHAVPEVTEQTATAKRDR